MAVFLRGVANVCLGRLRLRDDLARVSNLTMQMNWTGRRSQLEVELIRDASVIILLGRSFKRC